MHNVQKSVFTVLLILLKKWRTGIGDCSWTCSWDTIVCSFLNEFCIVRLNSKGKRVCIESTGSVKTAVVIKCPHHDILHFWRGRKIEYLSLLTLELILNSNSYTITLFFSLGIGPATSASWSGGILFSLVEAGADDGSETNLKCCRGVLWNAISTGCKLQAAQ